MQSSTVSFVIPAHDESALIGATLDAVHASAQALALRYDILVVDDASTDDTGARATAHGAQVLPVAHRQIAATRNAGAAAATGQRLIFVDADTLVNTAVLAAAIASLDGGAVGGGCAVRLLGRVRWSERLLTSALMSAMRWSRIAPGCFLFCTREAFDAVGGFDERWFAGEDVAISRALSRHGRFLILRESVATSDRKLRTFGWMDHLRLALRLAVSGRGILRTREHLDFWYGARRPQD